jgi:hypothetical protein
MLLAAAVASTARAFQVPHRLARATTTAARLHRQTLISSLYSSSALAMANVLKLSDPATQLLDQVDVFIFDCDGVIWRVRSCFL